MIGRGGRRVARKTAQPTELETVAARPKGLPAGTVSWLEIDLDALAANVRAFRSRLAPGARLMAVVKSNAYGHGAELVVPAVLDAGAEWLGVGNLAEALDARRIAGDGVPVLILQHVPAQDLPDAVAADLAVTVYDGAALERLRRAARRTGKPARVHLKLETGTHRQGLPLEDVLALAREVASAPELRLEGLSTHFADIEDTTDHRFAMEQLARFRDAVGRLEAEGIRPRYRHAACSAAAVLFPETHFDMVRVGIGLYGQWPSRETFVSARERGLSGFRLVPVLAWKAVIAQVKTVPPGGYVGYGRTWRATRATRIAVLPVGYYEGYTRSLSNRAYVLVAGRRAPVVGRICMNMMMADVTDIAEAAAGMPAVLIGRSGEEEIRAGDLAEWSGTIAYEVLSRLNPALPRIPVRGTVTPG
ncbi:MAG: alanine racemase [Acidobacteria bacterium]|nr:MAG: alanine racemase [Acidobacteriota bacterium]